ncbi:MAG: P1 family peptidase [Clostridia bacterium]|nr:P1 family peptidase [Clostridia bacterium]
MNKTRITDRGIKVGTLPAGPLDKISDVPGVTVGHSTVRDEYHKTGVTVIIPAPDNLFFNKLTAAVHVINGFGKTEGTVQIEELGSIETPIALTGTLNTGKVADALVRYAIEQNAAEGKGCRSVNPVVGETNDGTLSRGADRPVGYEQLTEAIAAASADFDEGDVGAGTGTVCFGLKGGIGSASRQLVIDGETYTVGALLQTNFGSLDDLTVAGIPAGRRIREIIDSELPPKGYEDKGSCMIIIATDIPLSELQLKRVLKRAVIGLSRAGSFLTNGSGDVVIGFTTANRQPVPGPSVREMRCISNDKISAVFTAAAEAVEESVYNSLSCADPVTANNGSKTVRMRALCEFPDALK